MNLRIITATGRVVRHPNNDAFTDERGFSVEVTPGMQVLLDAGRVKWENGTLVSDPVTLDEVKAKRKARIAAARYEAEFAGFTEPNTGMFVRTDARTRTLMALAVINVNADPAYTVPNWKTAEGVFITLDGATILALHGAMQQFIAVQFAKEAALSAQIDSALTLEEVNAIQW